MNNISKDLRKDIRDAEKCPVMAEISRQSRTITITPEMEPRYTTTTSSSTVPNPFPNQYQYDQSAPTTTLAERRAFPLHDELRASPTTDILSQVLQNANPIFSTTGRSDKEKAEIAKKQKEIAQEIINQRDDQGQNFLDIAHAYNISCLNNGGSKNWGYGLIKQLIEYKAQVALPTEHNTVRFDQLPIHNIIQQLASYHSINEENKASIFETIKQIIDANLPHLQAKDANGNTPLHLALKKDIFIDQAIPNQSGLEISLNIAQYILEKISNYQWLLLQNTNGNTPLHLALSNGYEEPIYEIESGFLSNERLHELNQTINQQPNIDTLFNDRYLQLAQLIIDRGGVSSFQNFKQIKISQETIIKLHNTPLHLALIRNDFHENIIKDIVLLGGNSNKPNCIIEIHQRSGPLPGNDHILTSVSFVPNNTPLHLLTIQHLKNIKTIQGHITSPIEWMLKDDSSSLSVQNHTAIIEFLGYLPQLVTKPDNTPLHLAIIWASSIIWPTGDFIQKRMLEYLIRKQKEQNVFQNYPNNEGKTLINLLKGIKVQKLTTQRSIDRMFAT